MTWVLLIFLIVGGVILKIFESVSDGLKLKREKNKQFGNRKADTSKDLYERNSDIIRKHKEHLNDLGPRFYYLENETRDCLNAIALAEENNEVRYKYRYLKDWKRNAPPDWRELAIKIECEFKVHLDAIRNAAKLKAELRRAENERLDFTRNAQQKTIDLTRIEIQNFEIRRFDPKESRLIQMRDETGLLTLNRIKEILEPNIEPWILREKFLSSPASLPNEIPHIAFDSPLVDVEDINNEIRAFNLSIAQDFKVREENSIFFRNLLNRYKNNDKECVIGRINYILNWMDLPECFPKRWEVEFDPDEGIALVEFKLPDVVHSEIVKEVALKKGLSQKSLTKKEAREVIPMVQPAIVLRIAYEIFRNDEANIVKLLAINGWIDFTDPTTGNIRKTYTASLACDKAKITGLNLEKLDPVAAFSHLKGRSAGRLVDIVPVTPILQLDRKDKRFIETKEVLGQMDSQSNLASMDWQDFENLIAELFQKEFSEEGCEIKLTQSSRDKGVDAVIFNPDPIRGGKYVIQAKRYTNTVDVSAVRDLVAVVAHEGASRGILVTTSVFGADAYSFVQGKPITLLDGSNLLGLLEKHGYKFRINLTEAKKLSV